MKWAGCVAHIGEAINANRILVRKSAGKEGRNLDVSDRVSLKWIFKEQKVRYCGLK
jgi:hypothetical protein